jgi:hypothetical protein
MWVKRSPSSSQRLSAWLRRLETRLETLIEGSAARIFPTVQTQHDLAERLVEAMRLGIQTSPNGQLTGPNLFILEVHPLQAEGLSANPFLSDGLTRALQEEGDEAGLKFDSPLAVRVSESAEVVPGEIRVKALHSQAGLTDTTAIEASPSEGSAWTSIPPNAFLIVDGLQIYPLRQAVVNIGRRADNHLVIEDTRVSRLHAQLRVVSGQFVIFDLESTGGTWVNGERIRQKILQPGDVISLSDLPLIYGQEAAYPEDTQKMSSLPG